MVDFITAFWQVVKMSLNGLLVLIYIAEVKTPKSES